ncbi:MAG: DUF3572 domain-containing protein [Rhizobiaceae bacterium]|nr:MAG: DUF3572 domain-containing protein [Rhizobiaceae bacterium]CAG1011012.1 hypothetical protein RHIZO_03898 [Rhizobiaceae bacterium]
MSRDDAEAVGIRALAFVAGDPDRLPRFLSITGIDAGRIRQAAGEPGFLAGVLDFVLAHEPTVIAFAETSGLDPSSLAAARRALPGGDDHYLAST